MLCKTVNQLTESFRTINNFDRSHGTFNVILL